MRSSLFSEDAADTTSPRHLSFFGPAFEYSMSLLHTEKNGAKVNVAALYNVTVGNDLLVLPGW